MLGERSQREDYAADGHPAQHRETRITGRAAKNLVEARTFSSRSGHSLIRARRQAVSSGCAGQIATAVRKARRGQHAFATYDMGVPATGPVHMRRRCTCPGDLEQ
eukprot:scaffold198276_cov39-Tisochrysis_lutea.AAC.2